MQIDSLCKPRRHRRTYLPLQYCYKIKFIRVSTMNEADLLCHENGIINFPKGNEELWRIYIGKEHLNGHNKQKWMQHSYNTMYKWAMTGNRKFIRKETWKIQGFPQLQCHTEEFHSSKNPVFHLFIPIHNPDLRWIIFVLLCTAYLCTVSTVLLFLVAE